MVRKNLQMIIKNQKFDSLNDNKDSIKGINDLKTKGGNLKKYKEDTRKLRDEIIDPILNEELIENKNIIKEIGKDGNCFYSYLFYFFRYTEEENEEFRNLIINYMKEN